MLVVTEPWERTLQQAIAHFDVSWNNRSAAS
jgi:hypothetical protein